jgi:hypothetical protein
MSGAAVLFGLVGVRRMVRAVLLCATFGLLTACGLPRHKDSPVIAPPTGAVEPACVPLNAGNPLIGTWYLVSKQAGVAGEMQTLLTLSADGKLKQQTRVKQGRNIRSELRETGCWEAPAGKLITRVSRSNGELIDFKDPIYSTTYVVEKVDANRLTYRLDRPDSKPAFAKKVQDSFRLM